MAYALGFPKDVTDRIYSMRDWRWEMVRDGFPTPSARCFEPMDEWYDPEGPPPYLWLDRAPEYVAEFEYGRWRYRSLGVKRNRAKIYVYDKNWESVQLSETSTSPPCIELPNQNLEKLQEKLEAATAELWWQCEPCNEQ